MTKVDGLYVVCPDLHFPYQDIDYTGALLDVVRSLKPRGFIQLGDAIDFFQLSTYDKNPARKNDILEDIEMYSTWLDHLENAMPKDSVIHQLEGNHSYRMIKYVHRNAAEIARIVPSLPQILKFKDRNDGSHKWYWHPYEKWDSCRIGDTVLHHGFYFDQNVAHNNLRRYRGVNFIQGHTHRVQYAENDKYFSATLGHGSIPEHTAHIPAPNDWSQAIGLLQVSAGKGSLTIHNFKNSAFNIWGKVFK